jgi:hypothetical protein
MLAVPISHPPILPGHDSIKLALRRTAKNFGGGCAFWLGSTGGAIALPAKRRQSRWLPILDSSPSAAR